MLSFLLQNDLLNFTESYAQEGAVSQCNACECKQLSDRERLHELIDARVSARLNDSINDGISDVVNREVNNSTLSERINGTVDESAQTLSTRFSNFLSSQQGKVIVIITGMSLH